MARRLIFVRSSVTLGGVERFLIALGERLRRRGWEVVSIFLHRGRGEHPAAPAARSRSLIALTMADRAAWDFSPLLALRRHLARLQPDIVHTHDYKSDLLVALLRGPRHLATAHGFTDADLRQRLYRRLNLLVLRRLPRLVVPSNYQGDVLIRAGVNPSRLHVIPPAPDWHHLEALAARHLPPSAEIDRARGPVITFVGRLSPEKGGDTLLAAFARLAPRHPTARLWLVGDGPCRRAWEHQARKMGIAARVHFWGWREDAAAFMCHSTVVALPSRREAFGLAALEAQGLGVPVVACPVDGMAEVLIGKGCISVPPHGVTPLAEALDTVISQPGLWQQRAREDAARVRAAFPFEEAVARHEALYEELLHMEA